MNDIILVSIARVVGAVVTTGAAVIEGASLFGARAFNDPKSTAEKVAKYVFVFFAVAAAILSTGGLFYTTLALVAFSFKSAAVCFAIAGVAAAISLPIHYQAFKWSKLI